METNPQRPILPHFCRHMWVSDAARDRWQPEIIRFNEAWRRIEWLSIVSKVRQCALISVSADELSELSQELKRYGLRARPLVGGVRKTQKGKDLTYKVVIGMRGDAMNFQDAWAKHDDLAIGALLGYPQCCCRSFVERFVENGVIDATWATALASAGRPEAVEIEVGALPSLNTFWMGLGLRLIPHFPCSYKCSASIELADKIFEYASTSDEAKIASAIREMLSWPLEWSSLHGIAEIRTPVLKISQRTEYSGHRQTLRWTGATYPKEGVKGLRFPYSSVGGTRGQPNMTLLTELVVGK